MSYSKKYGERTIEYRQAGHSLEATHQVFKVSKSTIQKWEKQLKETGNLEKKYLHRSFRKIDSEKPRAYVAAHPDAYQSEMAESFGCSESGIRDALRRHKITMYTAYIATARTKINSAFSGHVLSHQFALSTAVSNGQVAGTGAPIQDVVLMSERNVYGNVISSSECNGNGGGVGFSTFDKTQLPLFLLAPEFIQKERVTYWLRDIVAQAYFAEVGMSGSSGWSSANQIRGVRPYFSIS